MLHLLSRLFVEKMKWVSMLPKKIVSKKCLPEMDSRHEFLIIEHISILPHPQADFSRSLKNKPFLIFKNKVIKNWKKKQNLGKNLIKKEMFC